MYGTTGEEREGIQSGIVKDLEELLERKKSWENVLQVYYQRKARGNWKALGLLLHIPRSSFYLLIMVNFRGRLACCVS